MDTKETLVQKNGLDDNGWKGLFILGGICAILGVLVGVTDIVITMLSGASTEQSHRTMAEWFSFFQTNPLFAFQSLSFPQVISIILGIPLFLALYGAHRRINQAFASLALFISVIGGAVFIVNNAAIPLFVLSEKFASATTEVQRNLYLAAGEAILVKGEDFTFAVFIAFFLSELAGLAMALVMLRGKFFGKPTSYTGIAGFGLMIGFTCLSPIASFYQAAMIIAMLGGLLCMAWYILTALRLFKGAPK